MKQSLKFIQQLSFIVIFLLFGGNVLAKSVNTIKGVAKDFVGEKVEIYFIDDYLSNMRTRVAFSTVEADSTFKVSFFNDMTRKLYIQLGKNHFYIYAQPAGSYTLNIDAPSSYLGKNSEGTSLEYLFIGLDTNDINYKLLLFDNKQYSFLDNYYNKKSTKPVDFVAKLDTFKQEITKQYKADTSQFLKIYIKYSVAFLDDLPYVGQRNSYEKYDFYIKPESVWYQNDQYMDYIKHYYELYESQLSESVDEEFYQGVISSSPTLIMKALGGDYALKNLKLRELIMIKMLSEIFYSNIYPKTNIITILDSLSNHALFKENEIVASNIEFRLLDLEPGARMPDFSLVINGEKKFKKDYEGKHTYIQFVKKGNNESFDDLKLLYPLQQKYSKYISFITVLVTQPNDPLLEDPSSFIKTHKIAWDLSVITEDDPILKKFSVANYPYYLLMDAIGSVVAAPAYTPRPNNEYNTIENTFHSIKRYYERMEE